MNLLGYWKLDESSGTVAYNSANSNNFDTFNSPVFTSGGQFNI